MVAMVLAMNNYMNMDYVDIKPCPFCGGRSYIDVVFNQPFVNAHHTKKCKIRPNTWLQARLPLKKQIKAWNLRYED